MHDTNRIYLRSTSYLYSFTTLCCHKVHFVNDDICTYSNDHERLICQSAHYSTSVELKSPLSIIITVWKMVLQEFQNLSIYALEILPDEEYWVNISLGPYPLTVTLTPWVQGVLGHQKHKIKLHWLIAWTTGNMFLQIFVTFWDAHKWWNKCNSYTSGY